MSRAVQMFLILIPLTACADKGGDDTGETALPKTVSLEINLTDVGVETAVAGGTISSLGEDYSVDSGAYIYLEIPANEALVAEADAPSYMHSVLHYFSLEEDFSTYIPMLQTTTRDQLAGALGSSYDATKAMFMVRTYTRDATGALQKLGGVTVELDVEYEFAVTSTASSPIGVKPGNVTDDSSLAQITFINTAPGDAGLLLTLPEGVSSCTWYRGDLEVSAWKVPLVADAVNGAYIVCL
ncbi:hypothetical protein L6R49_09940 [Myxococcota bacterium]|nr:hypothetical protein [Myxococcota bacterium]